MNTYFIAAGVLCLVLGLFHSLLGEYLIFKSKREQGKLVPTKKSLELKERHLRILWATWHLASILGWCIGALLLQISQEQNLDPYHSMLQIITYAMCLSSILVFVGTKGKHPGWLVLLLIGILVFMGF